MGATQRSNIYIHIYNTCLMRMRNQRYPMVSLSATHCNTLQHTATHCNTLQHTATHCNTLQHTATPVWWEWETRGIPWYHYRHTTGAAPHSDPSFWTRKESGAPCPFGESRRIIQFPTSAPPRLHCLPYIYICMYIYMHIYTHMYVYI